jgi:hypothetical protein
MRISSRQRIISPRWARLTATTPRPRQLFIPTNHSCLYFLYSSTSKSRRSQGCGRSGPATLPASGGSILYHSLFVTINYIFIYERACRMVAEASPAHGRLPCPSPGRPMAGRSCRACQWLLLAARRRDLGP